MKTNNLGSDDILKIMNMTYSVFLAVLARFALEQVVSEGSVKVKFLISEENWCPVVFLYIYFIFDWLTTNITVPMKINIGRYLLLPLLVFSVIALGGLVAFSFSPSSMWVFCFGLYASIVPFYDINKVHNTSLSRFGLFLLYSVMLLRLTIGCFVVYVAVLKLWLWPESYLGQDGGWLVWLIGLYVVFKVIRYWALSELRA